MENSQTHCPKAQVNFGFVGRQSRSGKSGDAGTGSENAGKCGKCKLEVVKRGKIRQGNRQPAVSNEGTFSETRYPLYLWRGSSRTLHSG